MMFTKIRRLIDSLVVEGNLRPWFNNILVLLSFALMIALWYINLPFWVIYVVFCIGAVLGAVSAYSGRFGLKYFTNDPLGWRKAKESYLKKYVEAELKPSIDGSAEDAKR